MAGPSAAPRLILGLETSCDETAAAVITPDGRILSNVVSSQADLHARYGGVVQIGLRERRTLEGYPSGVITAAAVSSQNPEYQAGAAGGSRHMIKHILGYPCGCRT